MRILAALFVLMLLALTARATTYRWFDTNRPPISLDEALERGGEALGSHREKFYCVGAAPFGDEDGSGKDGGCHVYYGATDGSRKTFTLVMTGESFLTDRNGPIDMKKNEKAPSDLSEIKRRLIEILDEQKLTPYELNETGPNSFELSYQTREFVVHKRLDDGSYSVDTRKMIGPTRKGMWIRASIVKQPSPTESVFIYPDPYWNRIEHNFFLKDGKSYVFVEFRYGNDFESPVYGQLRQIFGERVEKW